MKLVFETPQRETLKAGFTRRRALLIAPFAFAGIAIVWARKSRDGEDSSPSGESNEEVTIVEFSDAGQKLGPARIRKVVRRARGAAWERAGALPGITVVHGSAEIRVYPPVPVDDWPAELARLQVSGTDFDDPRAPAAPAAGTPVLWLNPELPMTAGKGMAQVGHGAQLAWWRLPPGARSEWMDRDFDLAVRTAGKEQWAELLASGLPVVTDGGFTEVAPGSATVVADHPALRTSSPSGRLLFQSSPHFSADTRFLRYVARKMPPTSLRMWEGQRTWVLSVLGHRS